MPLAAARLARRLSSISEWLLLWLRVALQRCAANVCKKQMKTNAFPATAVHPRLCCTSNSSGSALPTQSERRGDTGTSPAGGFALVGRWKSRLSNAQLPAPARGAPRAAILRKLYSCGAPSCKPVQCSAMRIVQYTNRFHFCIARRDFCTLPIASQIFWSSGQDARGRIDGVDSARRRAGTLW